MSDYAMTQNNGDGGRDVEMSDVRLLDEDEMDDTLPFGQSNLTSVLANPDFARRRCCSRYARVISCIAVLSLFLCCVFFPGPGTDLSAIFTNDLIQCSTSQLQVHLVTSTYASLLCTMLSCGVTVLSLLSCGVAALHLQLESSDSHMLSCDCLLRLSNDNLCTYTCRFCYIDPVVSDPIPREHIVSTQRRRSFWGWHEQ